MRHLRIIGAFAVTVALAGVLAACGSSSTSTSSTSGGKGGATVTLLMGTAPDSLDPQFGYTTQSAEATWIAYLGLLTYGHANGTAGSQLIPALATSLPKISADGKTYTFTLRKGLVFSNGQPVKASDFAYSLKRAIKMPWGGSGQFINGNIVGAQAYAKGKASSVSGVAVDDATGKITIKLVAPYGAFENIVAFPALGIVPSGSPMTNQPANPPPGVGPYNITNIVPNVSFTMTRNPRWAQMNIPGIPAGHVDVTVKVQANTSTGAEQVLSGAADFFDTFDSVPPALLSQIQSQASSRFSKAPFNATYYFFLNTKTKPFSSLPARQAVMTALDDNALSRVGSGFFIPGCYFLPPGLVGHPTTTCPYGDPKGGGSIAKAKALVTQSGMAGTPITVWGQTRSPRRQFVDYYTDVLNKIGFKATEKIIADATYFPTIGNLKLNPQTGFADWNQDFPNPIDFYLLLSGSAILPTNNQNFGQVNDPVINSKVDALGKVPTANLSGSAAQWKALDEYVAKKAYVASWGYLTVPKFTSSRINYGATILSPQYGWDYSSFQLK